MGETSGDVVMVVVPLPAQGHLNQLLHFCRLVLLTSNEDVAVHFVGSATHNRQVKCRLHGWKPRCFPNLLFHDFPIPPFNTPPPNPHAAIKFPSHLQPAFDECLHLGPHVSLLLSSLSATARRVVVVHDSLMSFVADDATRLGNCESYAFHSVSVFANLFFGWESRGTLAEGGRKMFPHLPLLTSHGCFTQEFEDFIHRQHCLTAADGGVIFNTCRPIEADFIDLLAREPKLKNKPIFPIGPFNPLATEEQVSELGPREQSPRHECLRWLDRQPPSSVLYVSFGTTSTMCSRQINELASGIDASRQRFVWVLRDADRGDIFAEGDNIDVPGHHKKLSTLCSLAATGRGVIVGGWAPQLEILAHTSTGGFMSHCGWNSCMESFSHGVPMVAWPMHSDQPRNALMTTHVLRVGVAVREWSPSHEVVPAAKVEAAIRRLMDSDEGEEMRRRAENLGSAVRRSQTKGGTSRKALESFVSHITRP